jgi:glc operon protein GlcG
MHSLVNGFTAITSAILICVSPAAWALDKAPVLTMDLAKKIAAGCETKAKEMNWKMNISVVDSGANQIFFERMDGAYLGSGDIALHKAQTSARFPSQREALSNLPFSLDGWRAVCRSNRGVECVPRRCEHLRDVSAPRI